MSGWRAALVAAVVGGLILLTGYLVSRDDSADPGDGTGPATTAAARGDLASLACAPALASACDEIAAQLGTTAVRYRSGADPGAGVVVIAPARDLPAQRAPGPVVARSPIAVAVWLARTPALQGHCATDVIDPGCLATAYGMTWADLGGNPAWGDFKLGLADATGSEAGAAAWRAIAGQGVPSGLAASLRLVAQDDGALMVEIAQFGDSRVDATVTTEAAIASQLGNLPGRGGRLEVFYPDPAPWVEYVASGNGGDAERLVAALLDPDLQQRLPGYGLRPAEGAGGEPMSGLGTPGQPLPPTDDATRGTLDAAWEGIR